jgi:carnitine O-acetyltransferase
MFDCCRVPGPEGLDWSVTYAKEGEIGDSGHIIVFRRNRPWRVETTENGRILSVEEIQRYAALRHLDIHSYRAFRQIQFIYDNTDNTYPGVGVLTSNNRDVWAKVSHHPLGFSPEGFIFL